MLKPSCGCNLALESRDRYSFRQVGAKHLHYDPPTEARVARYEDARHPSTAELTLERIACAEHVLQAS